MQESSNEKFVRHSLRLFGNEASFEITVPADDQEDTAELYRDNGCEAETGGFKGVIRVTPPVTGG